MSTPPPGNYPPAGYPDAPTPSGRPYPGPPGGIPPYAPQAQRPKKRTGLILGLTGAAVFLLVVALAVVFTVNGGRLLPKTDPTPTMTGKNRTEWVSHLPYPCKGVPDSAIRAAGLDPRSRTPGSIDPRADYAGMISCDYRSPVPPGETVSATWSLSIDYAVFTFEETLNNPVRIDLKPTSLHGQPASFYRIGSGYTPPSGLHECGIVVGTVFGTATYFAGDNRKHRLTQQQTCDKAWQAANQFQPYIPTDPLRK